MCYKCAIICYWWGSDASKRSQCSQIVNIAAPRAATSPCPTTQRMNKYKNTNSIEFDTIQYILIKFNVQLTYIWREMLYNSPAPHQPGLVLYSAPSLEMRYMRQRRKLQCADSSSCKGELQLIAIYSKLY